jgi:uncharacterized protein YgfB (UPF0149 family)
MNTHSFPYVEDYIEFIGGYRDRTGKSLTLWDAKTSPVNLARYDVGIINSLSVQTNELARPYTDKQAELAIRLILKYTKQLNNLDIILPNEFNQFRYGIRQVDRTKKIYLENNSIVLKFPYDTKILAMVKKCVKEGIGSAKFDSDRKLWILGLTEYNLNWSMTVALMNEFSIETELQMLYNSLLEVEKTSYKIELQLSDNKFIITNAADSLLNYVEERLGGFGIDNILTLADYSSICGYTLSDEVFYMIKKLYPSYRKLILNRKIKLDKKDCSMEKIIEYARLTNRLPVYLYETQLPFVDTDDIKCLNNCNKTDIVPKLFVSKTSIMIGPKKQAWRANSEKVIILY